MTGFAWWRVWLAGVLVAAPVGAQELPEGARTVASVDLYGLRSVSAASVRRALRIEAGEALPDSAGRAAAMARVRALDGVRHARATAVCCAAAGGVLLYVGVEERGTAEARFAPEPTGSVDLPSAVVEAGAVFERAFAEAIENRDFAETDTAGHAIMHWPAAAAAQERFVELADRYGAELRAVLVSSADAGDRALAAQVLAYSRDKAAVVDDLARALHDPADEVRNDATRALALIALLAQRRPELGMRVPTDGLVNMLESPVWTDRNKASLALSQLVLARDAGLLEILRERSLPALREMAGWQELGHAMPSLMILGVLAGMPDEAIGRALQSGDRAAILSAAESLGR